jgi:putative ABC transport system permease protein
VAYETVITWGLGKAVGDTLAYRDESGRTWKIKLVGGIANSIFQGNIIISEKAFIRKYPSLSGFRLFLVDASFPEAEAISRKIDWALRDQGIDLVKTSDRLAAFSAVENTYLSIFLILGTFGLILGSIGIGIVLGRNVAERRGELAVLQAVGFPKSLIRRLLFTEHSILLMAGLGIGMGSALLATAPVFLTPGSNVPLATIVFSLILVFISGGFWTWAATVLATKNDLLPSLRNE